MKKWMKTVSIVSCTAFIAGAVAGLSACVFDLPIPEHDCWTVTVANYDDNCGKVEVSAPAETYYSDGEEVTVTVTAYESYKVASFLVNGLEKDLVGGQYVFAIYGHTRIDVGFESTVVYPDGITADSFEEHEVGVAGDGSRIENTKASLQNALRAGGTIYLKEDTTLPLIDAHSSVANDLTIYANGADFGKKDIAIGTYVAPTNSETTINIYGAKNLVVWGNPVTTRSGEIWNVNFYDCVNDDCNFLMYRGSGTEDSVINLTLTNCVSTGYDNDSTIHTTADGTITLTGCTFNTNCAPVNIAHKQSGDMTIVVENCTFNGCGKDDVADADNYYAPARFVNNSEVGTMSVTLKNNVFVDTIGPNGDIMFGDFRDGKKFYTLTATIITETPVLVRATYGEPVLLPAGTHKSGND